MFSLLFNKINRYFLLLLLLSSVQLNQAQTPTPTPATAEKEAQKSEKSKTDEKKEDKKDDNKKSEKAVKTPLGRLPVIIIPGLIGSELINKNTSDKVWFSLRRAKEDDLRLPISPDLKANKDSLIPGDILRKFKVLPLTPDIEIYQKLVESLEKDGYTEGKWDAPDAGGDADTFYVFPYDWRLDNVENAQLLLQKIDELRVKLNRPNLKFNIVAHSMGGLIARYAALYGKSDLTNAKPAPTWQGSSYIYSMSLIATPNGGATSALNSLLKGFSLFGGGKLNLPFIQKITKFDLFTVPSVYQLLPHSGAVRAFDENLRPLKIDIYDPATWEKYGWAAYTDEDFNKNFEPAEQAQAKEYFRAVLLRAKLFQDALDAKPAVKSPIPTYYLGSECKPTMDGFVIRSDAKKGWITEFGSPSYTKSDGGKVKERQTKILLNSSGDGVVPKSSLIYSYVKLGTRLQNPRSDILINDVTISCDDHNRLTANIAVDKNLGNILKSSIPETNPPSLVKPGNEGNAGTSGRRTRTPVRKVNQRKRN